MIKLEFEFLLLLPLLIIVGFIVGILGSLFGIGGGFLVAPILTFIFDYFGIPDGVKFAVGTSLFVVFINSIISIFRHAKIKNINWKASITIGIISLVFSYFSGFLVVNFIDSAILKKLFGIFLIANAIYMAKSHHIDKISDREDKLEPFILCGVITGFLSGLFGIGGGIVIIPILAMAKYPVKRAVAISVGVIPLTSIGGLISYLTANTEGYIYNIGYVSIPIALIMAIPIIYSSKLGIKINQKISPKHLRIMLSSILGVMGLFMLL
ncbi:sulfite exporter TauE/SafE family protein [Methanocaldococcus jannaschii]|uniref:sulfite exporter TauE/SafE family protein n=1 Tax=Methanocaldococcus jannaschii TaxID=2190 RepID=UPI001FCC005B|nr:sulfite exporter TauE/SafE family protein [Methanocaldococcus jannaschii]